MIRFGGDLNQDVDSGIFLKDLLKVLDRELFDNISLKSVGNAYTEVCALGAVLFYQ